MKIALLSEEPQNLQRVFPEELRERLAALGELYGPVLSKATLEKHKRFTCDCEAIFFHLGDGAALYAGDTNLFSESAGRVLCRGNSPVFRSAVFGARGGGVQRMAGECRSGGRIHLCANCACGKGLFPISRPVQKGLLERAAHGAEASWQLPIAGWYRRGWQHRVARVRTAENH